MAAIVPLPNGAKLSLATLAAAIAVTGISNANPGVISAPDHGLAAADIVLLQSPGWSDANNVVGKVAPAPAADSLSLVGLNTTDVDRFPAGAGAGDLVELATWTPLPKIPSFERTGGDPKSQNTSYLDYEKDLEFFTGANPERLNFTMSYDPDGAAHAALIAAAREDVSVLRLVLKNGDALYYVGQLFFNPSPTTTKDNEMVVTGALALQGPISRIKAA